MLYLTSYIYFYNYLISLLFNINLEQPIKRYIPNKLYIIELKIWHGDEYNKRGEQQLVGYLEDYHVDKGYMLSFNFNRKKQSGIRKIIVNGKTIVEAVV